MPEESISSTFDAVVIGGGPHGLTYAHWLQRNRPGTRIAVVERNQTPGFKIGESTLSSATRSMVATGLPMPVLRRLFGNKAGVRFWWTDHKSETLLRHVDVVDIEETFQVERRVLEIAMQEAIARRPNITLLTGTKVELARSDLEGDRKQIACIDGDGNRFTLDSSILCDASGPSALLARHRGELRKDPETHNTFSTNSYYAYFRGAGPEDVPHWNEPATRHICFPGGWTWFITLASWEKTPEENLRQMIRFLLDHPEGPDESYPSREELCTRFGCTTEQITSIGFVVRNDRDPASDMNAADAFDHYARNHPAISRLLDSYELIDRPYNGRPTFGAFHNLLHRAEQTAGDGWVIVGDAGLFVNPLFSPGLNLGSGTCYLAAEKTAEGLDVGDISRSRFTEYESYVSGLYDALVGETDLYYRSFDDVELYELALMLKIFFAAADVLKRTGTYSRTDLYAHDLLNPEFREIVDGVRTLLRTAEADHISIEERRLRVEDVIRPFLNRLLNRPEVRKLRIGSLFSEYNAQAMRIEKVRRRRKSFGVRRCRDCRLWSDRTLLKCPACGAEPGQEARSRRMETDDRGSSKRVRGNSGNRRRIA